MLQYVTAETLTIFRQPDRHVWLKLAKTQVVMNFHSRQVIRNTKVRNRSKRVNT